MSCDPNSPTNRWCWCRVEADGSIVIGPEFVRMLGAAAGDKVQLEAIQDGGRIVVRNTKAALSDLQDELGLGRDANRSTVDEFLAERRAMWGEE